MLGGSVKTVLHWLLVIAIILIAAAAGFLLIVADEVENRMMGLPPVGCLIGSAILLWPTFWRSERHLSWRRTRWALALALLAAGLLLPGPVGTVEVRLPEARYR